MESKETKTFKIHGISKVSSQRQVSLPKELADILEIAGGDKFYWIDCHKNPEHSDTYTIHIKVIKKRGEE